ncbi:MAG: hypothetical protein IPP40_06800 [bacterium]|nr:hypothetical protein [bacterium]
MKLNLLNLLKANVLKPGVIKTIAPVTESGKASEFKSVLSGVQAIPPPGLAKKIPNVEPPVEESAVLISKRYSKSHAESQGKVKESGKSEKLVEQTLQTAISSLPATVVVQTIGASAPQPVIEQPPHEVKQLPVDNHVVSKAAPVVRTPEAAKAASKAKAMPESTRAPVLQPVNKVVPERVSQNGTVEAPLREERSTSATLLVPPLVISRERTLQNPVTNRQSDKQSSHVPNEFSVVRATNTLELQTSRDWPNDCY